MKHLVCCVLLVFGCRGTSAQQTFGARSILTVQMPGGDVVESVAAKMVYVHPTDEIECSAAVAILWDESVLYFGENVEVGSASSGVLQVSLIGAGRRLVSASARVTAVSLGEFGVELEQAWDCPEIPWVAELDAAALQGQGCSLIGYVAVTLESPDGFSPLCSSDSDDVDARESVAGNCGVLGPVSAEWCDV